MEKARQGEDGRRAASTTKAVNIVGPNATVLRLGAKAPPKPSGIMLKTPTEKPSLIAKPTAPLPTKSPWASLPPVDKVAPVAINPTQAQQMYYQRQESLPRHAEQVLSTPAMEIAADSFTRTPRDSTNASQGQLYNSQSGQYETVSSNRRGSNKRDQNFRPPSLLQRPASNDKNALAQSKMEIALLSRRTSIGGAEMEAVPRRESNTKNDVRYGENTSFEAPPQTGSLGNAVGSPETNDIPTQSASTYGSGIPRAYPFRKPGSTADGSNHVNSPGTASSTMSPMSTEVNAQKQLMQESIEKARQRKQEEMQREEAARQERIRKKLEALGPLPVKEAEHKAHASDITGPSSGSNDQAASNEATKAPTAVPSSQINLPNGTKEKKSPSSDRTKAEIQTLINGDNNDQRGKVSASDFQRSPIQSPNLSRGKALEKYPVINGSLNRGLEERNASGVLDSNTEPSQRAHKQLWTNGGESYNGWKNSGMATHASAVHSLWGPPPHQKGIGNGAFDQAMHTQHLSQSPFQDHHSSPALQPIGPPRVGQRVPPIEEISSQPPNPRENPHGLAPQHPSTSPTYQLQLNDKSSSGQGRAPASKQPHSQNNTIVSHLNSSQRAGLSAWDDFKVNTSTNEREQARQAHQRFAALTVEEQKKVHQLPEISETWRQLKKGAPSDQRLVVSVHKDQITQDSHESIRFDETNPHGQAPVVAPLPNVGRVSRFMPFMEHSYQMPVQHLGVIPVDAPRSPSPPPPDTVLHPAFDRPHSLPRPRVNLPGAAPQGAANGGQQLDVTDFSLGSPREKPKVRLPPPGIATASESTPAPLPNSHSEFSDTRATPLRAVSQPLVNNKAWQDRFNGLLGTSSKKLTPEKPTTTKMLVPSPQAITSTSRDPLELLMSQMSAAVSLPAKDADLDAIGVPIESSSRPMEDEEALYENREFGSLPTVKLAPVDTTWKQAKSSKSRRVNKTPAKEVMPSSRDTFDHSSSTVPGGFLIFISVRGMVTPKSRILRHPGSQGGVANDPRQRTLSLNQKSVRVPRMRENSSSYQQRLQPPGQSQTPVQHTEIPPNPSNTGARGFYNKRHGHGQSHGHAPWHTNHRVASAAH